VQRLGWAFKIHLNLCEHKSVEPLEAQIDKMAEDDLLIPLLALARKQHTLNYIAFRTLHLFTFTYKSAQSLARLGVFQVVMDTLRRPQEPLCVRYSLSVLFRVCMSPQCRTIDILSTLVHKDAITLWSIINRNDDIKTVRLQVLKILSAMLLTHKGRHVRHIPQDCCRIFFTALQRALEHMQR
jgi:hypothetical protein